MNTGNRNTGNRNTGNRNTGNMNSGKWNTGIRNTGSMNSGNWNSGNWNTGNRNTGDWNTVDKETGFFNTEESEKVRVFNKECLRSEWEAAIKPDFLYFPLTEWVSSSNMSDKEKKENPLHETTGGYLKKYTYKEAFKRSWNKASPEDRDLVTKLPRFDADVFYEISGIRIDDTQTPKEIVIDGETYLLVKK